MQGSELDVMSVNPPEGERKGSKITVQRAQSNVKHEGWRVCYILKVDNRADLPNEQLSMDANEQICGTAT